MFCFLAWNREALVRVLGPSQAVHTQLLALEPFQNVVVVFSGKIKIELN